MPACRDSKTTGSPHAKLDGDAVRNDTEITASDKTDDAERESVPTAPLPSRPSAHRLLLLLPGGPLVGDLWITIDGQPFEQYVDEIVRESLRWIDQDDDGVASWSEATTSARLIHGQLGNDRINSEDQRQQVLYRCDVNRNGRVDASEVASFLTPRGRSSRWIDVDRSSAGEASQNPPRLFKWLDSNRDLTLDANETDRAATRLRMLDHDDDGIVSRDDLPGRVTVNRRNARNSQRPAVLLLRDDTDWSRTLFTMEERYALGSPIQSLDLPNANSLFAEIDADNDGYWSVVETSQLLVRPADLVIQVNLGASDNALHVQSRASLPIDAGANRTRVTLPGGDLSIQWADQDSDVLSDTDWMNQWKRWDQNQDDALDADEYTAAENLIGLPLVAADADGDGRVQATEGIDAMRRRQRPQAARILVALRPTTTPLWSQIDADRDDRLVEREMRQAPEQLRGLGENLTVDQLPSTYTLRFTRGTTDRPARTVPSTAVPIDSPNVPRWFAEMDQNRDGEIGKREFLGPLDTFDQLDANQDRAIQAAELPPATN